MSFAVTSKAKWTASKFSWGVRKLWTGGKYLFRGLRFTISLPFIIMSFTITIAKYALIFFILLLILTVAVGML